METSFVKIKTTRTDKQQLLDTEYTIRIQIWLK